MFKLVRKRRERSVSGIEEEPCIHHWIYETANGPTSKGRCKKGGARHEGSNHVLQPRFPDGSYLVY